MAAALLASALQLMPAAQAVERYTGDAYARDSGQLLYREVHFLYGGPEQSRQLVLYRCPGGAPFARKLLQGAPDAVAPDFEFVDARSGYREGARRTGGGREVYVQKNADASTRSKILPHRAGAVVDAGFDAYVRRHWAALAGGPSTIPFLLPSRLAFLPIRLSDTTDDEEHGTAVRKLSMRLDTWYGFALPPIRLVYRTADRRLLRFEGIGTIRDREGRNQDVRIEFPPDARQPAVPQAELDAALDAPLTGRCNA